jgi:hypothetical protein
VECCEAEGDRGGKIKRNHTDSRHHHQKSDKDHSETTTLNEKLVEMEIDTPEGRQ